jgi:glycosyltransferase involved in cell wall biosynthesis
MINKISSYASTVSIGMPVYNGEKYIREALDSLLSQTFTDFELIISDNASTDDTSKICQEYANRDSRIRYIRQAANIGANANFEFVLMQAIAELFMWAACDDYLESKNYLTVMVNTMQTGCDFCFPNVKLLNENFKKKTISDGVMSGFSNCVTNYDYSRQTVFTCSYQIYGLFRRNFLIEHYKYIDQCKHFRSYGEGLFVHAITANSKLSYVPDACLIYRRHEENISSVQKTSHLLPDLAKFTYMLFSFYYLHKEFSFLQKIFIIKSILYIHIKHALILIFPSIFKKKSI